MCEAGFFEGPEKLLEVWWKPRAELTENERGLGDMRRIPREKWEDLLKLVNCGIISQAENGDMVAYLLTESSMFVSKERVILKTCGSTTLLYCIKPLLKLAKEYGLDEVQDFFFSRMTYQQPALQHGPHQTFGEEIECLDKIFSDYSAAAYVLGKINGPDTWYLYTLTNALPGVNIPDQTIEILMQDLDKETMKKFYKGVYPNTSELRKDLGIVDFVPKSIIDDSMFDPCGYSLNGLLSDSYFTIHVTPQEECSYASFETNLKLSSYHELINKVLTAFKPGRFLMTLFANEGAPCGFSYKTFEEGKVHGYERTDLQLCQMKHYNLTYGHYEKVKCTKSLDIKKILPTVPTVP